MPRAEPGYAAESRALQHAGCGLLSNKTSIKINPEDGRIKVLILLPNLDSGGGQRIVINFFKQLNRALFRPLLLVQERRGAFLREVEHDCDTEEVEFLQEHPYRRTDLPALIWKTCARARAFHIVLGGLEGRASGCGLIAAKLLRKPFVGWIHIDWLPYSTMVSWRQTLALRAYALADRIVACSVGAAENFSTLFKVRRDRVTAILNMIPCDRIVLDATEPLPAEHAPLFEKPTVVMVGRLDEQKGYPHLLRAHARLIDTGIDHNLVIIGEGVQHYPLLDLAKQLGVAGSVHFLQFQMNPHRYMARATVFALSSEFEGFGLVLAEALMCGVPVVATDCLSGPAEVLQNGAFGLLVPPKDPVALAAALERFLTNPDLRAEFAARGPKRARQFDQSTIGHAWQDLLTSVVSDRDRVN